jgi:putative flippase GtrA
LVRMGANYLVATAVAVECAVLHNFIWHERVTWRERVTAVERCRRLLRFNLANGVISMAGNLIAMRLLVKSGVAYMVANLLSIAICSLANFAVSELWVFRARPTRESFDQMFIG